MPNDLQLPHVLSQTCILSFPLDNHKVRPVGGSALDHVSFRVTARSRSSRIVSANCSAFSQMPSKTDNGMGTWLANSFTSIERPLCSALSNKRRQLLATTSISALYSRGARLICCCSLFEVSFPKLERRRGR